MNGFLEAIGVVDSRLRAPFTLIARGWELSPLIDPLSMVRQCSTNILLLFGLVLLLIKLFCHIDALFNLMFCIFTSCF